MSLVAISIDDRAIRLFRKDLQDMARDLAGTNRMRQPLLDSAKEVLIPSFNKNFQVGGRPRWEPSVPISTYRIEKKASGSPTLWVTGKMKKAATRMARFKVLENKMTYGYFPPTVWYAMVHDSDVLATRAKIPTRPFALIQPEDVDDITRIFMRWYESMVNKHIKFFYAGSGTAASIR